MTTVLRNFAVCLYLCLVFPVARSTGEDATSSRLVSYAVTANPPDKCVHASPQARGLVAETPARLLLKRQRLKMVVCARAIVRRFLNGHTPSVPLKSPLPRASDALAYNAEADR